ELRQDHRVIIKDKLNARYIGFEDIPQKVDLITVDVSFISIKQILPNIKKFLNPDGRIIALIKPQFETQKQNLTKKGIVKTQMLQEIGDDIDDFVKKEGFKALGKTYIHEYFPNKNKEWFIIMQNL
ncbi:MAG TPA: TlyA family RNA methyltransferase, partial [Clostridiales bacterium]|nr:TlyA family RNA methyltransferase [Clostridiales bacterium]